MKTPKKTTNMSTGKIFQQLIAYYLAGLVLSCYPLHAGSSPPEIAVPRIDVAPRLDGKLDDACWVQAYTDNAFYDFTLGKPAVNINEDTTLRMGTDGSWLFLGFECRHPDPGDMWAQIKENYGGRIWGDECIKIFLNPGMGDGEHYRYVLNIHNTHENARSFTVHDSSEMLPWPSAVQITQSGWTAEVAIPLFELAGYGDLRDFQLNVFRKKIIKEYDASAVHVGNNEYVSVWQPASAWTDRKEMPRLIGLTDLHGEFPFVSSASKLELGEIRDVDGKMFYDVSLELKSMTSQSGTATVGVMERTGTDEVRKFHQSFNLQPHQSMPVTMSVPMTDPGRREIEVTVRDQTTDMLFYTAHLADEGGLMQARPRFNYYTSESYAETLYEIALSEKLLADCRLTARNNAGELLAQAPAGPTGILKLPLAKIALGEHLITLAVEDTDERAKFATEFTLTKFPPNPGHEWKIDRAAGGTLLHNGEPFFPFGTILALDEEHFKEAADAGMNSVVWWFRGYDGTLDSIRQAAQLAEKYGLKILVNFFAPSRAAEMTTLPNYFPDEKKRASAVQALDSLIRLKLHNPLFTDLTREQRNNITTEWIDLHLPAFAESIHALRDAPALMGYLTMDEPSFTYVDVDLCLVKLYQHLKQHDVYHPMFCVYSSHIPNEPRAVSFFDCLGTDPYWTPGRPLPRGTINWMSTTTAKTVARADKEGMMPWAVPQASLWSHVVKRMITPEEQICQTYLALIHGTRGIWYFTHGWFTHKDQWQAVRKLAQQVRVLAPALTAPRPEQTITYTPGNWAPLKNELPDVQANLLRYPNGRYVLLLANVLRSEAEITVETELIQPGAMNDLFEGQITKAQAGIFIDQLAARGVRAYDFGIQETDAPAKIKIQIRAAGDLAKCEPGYDQEGRTGMKNIQPNPSFEEATHPDWPDYFWPYSGGGYAMKAEKRIGMPQAGFGLSKDRPFHGDYCVFLTQDHALHWRIAPQFKTEKLCTFSFYARTDAAEPLSLLVKSLGNPGWRIGNFNSCRISVSGNQWKRYTVLMRAEAKMNVNGVLHMIFRDAPDATLWLDAFQIEEGLEATEFEP